MNIEKVSVDSISRADFRRLVDLEKNCGLPDPYPPELIYALLCDMDHFVCREEGTIAGFVTVNPRSTYLNGSIYIVNINVARECRGRGIAKRLLLSACRFYAPRFPNRLVSLDVTKTNPARRLYEQIGFRQIPIPSRNGETDIVMAAPISLLIERLERLIDS